MAEKLMQSFAVKAATDEDPVLAFKFWIELESIIVAEFTECSGLSIEREVETVKEGGVNDRLHVLPGRSKYSNITLKHGIIHSKEMWDWYQEGLYDGKVKRVNFSILLRDIKGDVVRRWNVVEAFPVKWEGPQLSTESGKVTVESLEIAHHGLGLDE